MDELYQRLSAKVVRFEQWLAVLLQVGLSVYNSSLNAHAFSPTVKNVPPTLGLQLQMCIANVAAP